MCVRGLNNMRIQNYDNLNSMNFFNEIKNVHDIKMVCSYDYCDYIDSNNIKFSFNKFVNKYIQQIDDEEIKNTLKVKGIKITKIIYKN